MGLFRKKQGDMESSGKQSSALPIFPKYAEESEEPIRISIPKMPSLPPMIKTPPIEEQEPEYHVPEFEEFQAPIRRPSKPLLSEPIEEPVYHQSSGDNPIFVKLEKYKTALNDINDLKKKIKEAEDLLAQLEEIKSQEDRELSNWQKHLADIKAKLLEVDRNLFEV